MSVSCLLRRELGKENMHAFEAGIIQEIVDHEAVGESQVGIHKSSRIHADCSAASIENTVFCSLGGGGLVSKSPGQQQFRLPLTYYASID